VLGLLHLVMSNNPIDQPSASSGSWTTAPLIRPKRVEVLRCQWLNPIELYFLEGPKKGTHA